MQHHDVKKWLLILSFFCLLIFLTVVQGYLTNNILVATDIYIANFLFTIRSIIGLYIFNVITIFGSPLIGSIIVLTISVVFFWRKKWKTALVGLCGFIGIGITTFFLKNFFHRIRPDVLLLGTYENSYSLPSGHATTIAFVFGYLAYLSILRYSSKKIRIGICVLVSVIIVAVDFSRMYLGMHYLSDIIAGNMIGLLGLFVIIIFDQWFYKNGEHLL